MKDEIRIMATLSFKSNLEKIYPNKKSTTARIRELNKVLETLIYGKKK